MLLEMQSRLLERVIHVILQEASNDDLAERMVDYMTTTPFDIWWKGKFKQFMEGSGTKTSIVSDIKTFFSIGDTRAQRLFDHFQTPTFNRWYTVTLEKLIQDDFPDDDYENRKNEIKAVFSGK